MKYVYSESIKDAYQEDGEKGLIYFWFISLVDGIKSLFIQHLENEKGGENMKKDIIMQNKVFFWLAVTTVLILSIPFIAMQFDTGVNWSSGDFVVMGVMIFGFGSLFVIVARLIPVKYRALAAFICVAAFLWLWVELAVGLFTNWGS